jgi:AcrR family transcriptional regulator
MSVAAAHPPRGAGATPQPPSGVSVTQAVAPVREHAAPVAAPRWQRRKDARPGELLAAALEQFVEKGYAATKLEDVARRAGVTKGTMYLYFESKEALFKAVVRANVLPRLEHAEQLVAAHQGNARDLLVQFLRGWMDTLYHTPLSGLAKLVISESANFPEVARFFHEEVVDRKHRLMRGILERGVASGEFRAMDVENVARVLRAPAILAAVWKHSLIKSENCVLDAPAFFEAALDVMLNGILADRELHTEKPNA